MSWGEEQEGKTEGKKEGGKRERAEREKGVVAQQDSTGMNQKPKTRETPRNV